VGASSPQSYDEAPLELRNPNHAGHQIKLAIPHQELKDFVE
jgi:hypothetical protein